MMSTSFYPEKAVIKAILLLWFWGCLSPVLSFGQSPLNRRITVKVQAERLDHTLGKIEQEADIFFAYRNGIFRPDSLVDLSVKKESVKITLDELFDKKMEYRVVGNHIVLKPVVPRSEIPRVREKWFISGYLLNSRNGKKVPLATVYESSRKNTILTNSDGYYELEIDPEVSQLSVAFRKPGFRDTVVVVKPKAELSLSVGIEPNIPELERIESQRVAGLMKYGDVEDLPMVRFIVPEKQQKLSLNVLIPIGEIPVQFSVWPGISTNRLLSGGMRNHFSVNIFAGYNHSVAGLEVGGFVNILRDDMRGLQAAGLANIVGGEVKGLQAAGVFNHVRGNVNGLQAGGIYNKVNGNAGKIQAAGLFNQVSGEFSGLQAAGFGNNVRGNFSGFQAAGFGNNVKGDFRGLQAAGFANRNGGEVRGLQVAGFLNHTRKGVSGGQIAGFMNHSESVGKIQIAGFLNHTGVCRGSQIGIVNISDTLEGASVGLFTWVKSGYRAVEVHTSDVHAVAVNFKTGTNRLYNFYTAGLTFGHEFNWSFGAGFGTRFEHGSRFVTNLELGVNHFNANARQLFTPELNMLIRFRPTFAVRANRFEIFGGPTANLWITQLKNPDTGEFFHPSYFPSLTRNAHPDTRVAGWVGFKAGVRM